MVSAFVIMDTGIKMSVPMYPIGDATGNGQVNIGDVSRLYAHIRGAV